MSLLLLFDRSKRCCILTSSNPYELWLSFLCRLQIERIFKQKFETVVCFQIKRCEIEARRGEGEEARQYGRHKKIPIRRR